jgi:hypothetical protein
LRTARLRHQRHSLRHPLESTHNNELTGTHSSHNLDNSLRPRAKLHHSAARLAAGDDPHDIRRAQWLNRILGNDDRIRASRRRKSRFDEHSGLENAARISGETLHHDRAIRVLHDWIDEVDSGSECLAGLSGDGKLDCLSELESRCVTLGHFDHGALWIYSLECEKGRSRRDVIADAHESLTDHAGKRSTHHTPRDLKL